MLPLAMGTVGGGDVGNVDGLGVANTSMVGWLGSLSINSTVSRIDCL